MSMKSDSEQMSEYFDRLHEHFRNHGDRTALSDHENSISYTELLSRADALSRYLAAQGIEPGDRAALLAKPGIDWGIAFFGVLLSGAVLVPLDTLMSVDEMKEIIEHAEPSLLISTEDFKGQGGRLSQSSPHIILNEGIETSDTEVRLGGRNADDVMAIIYTSGTTGTPKGIMATYGNLLSQVREVGDFMGYEPEDVSLSVLPLNYMMELTIGFLCPLYVGARVHFCDSLYPQDIMAAAQGHDVSFMVMVPRLLKLMRRMIGDTPNPMGNKLKAIICGSAPVSEELLDYFQSFGVKVCQGYGMTETSPVIAANSPSHNKPGSVGRPYTGVEVKIAEDEEILVRGPSVMKGYFKDEEQTDAIIKEGWLHTGDLGSIDEDGYLHIHGRKKDLIVLSSGKNVYPEQLAEYFLRLDLVQDACIFHISEEEYDMRGEGLCIVINPADKFEGNPKQMAEGLRELAGSIDAYKRPTHMVVTTEPLPKTHSMKTKRFLVKAWLKEQDMVQL